MQAIPFDVALGLTVIGTVAGLLIGAAIGAWRRADDLDLSDHVVSAMREVAEWEQPRLLEWDEETRLRWRAQQATRRVA